MKIYKCEPELSKKEERKIVYYFELNNTEQFTKYLEVEVIETRSTRSFHYIMHTNINLTNKTIRKERVDFSYILPSLHYVDSKFTELDEVDLLLGVYNEELEECAIALFNTEIAKKIYPDEPREAKERENARRVDDYINAIRKIGMIFDKSNHKSKKVDIEWQVIG